MFESSVNSEGIQATMRLLAFLNPLRHLMLHPKLLRRAAAIFFETFDHMAAVGKSGFLTDIGEVEVCEKKKILHLKNFHFFNICLAAFSVKLLEFLGKAGIAEPAL